MDVRILGPLEVEDRNAPVALGGQKQRALLALLVLGRGSVVTTDRLIEELWAGDPPATARNAVQGHVGQLRKALAPNGRLETRGGGYALALEPGELDLDRFETLVERGREQLAAGDASAAAGTLRDALALWRGAALGDLLGEPFAAVESARLEERRLSCLEERIEADLALGRHVDLVPELERLVGDHPLRERFRAQLMLALYRSGRQAEALEAYQDARRTLVDELGIEPGPQLQDLERQILNQDPALEPPQPPEPAQRRGNRRAWFLVAAGALLVAGAVATAVIQLTGSDSASIDIVAGNAVALIDPATNEVVAQIPVGRTPSAISVSDGVVWALSADDQTISRIDPETKEVQTFATGSTPTDIAAADNVLWVGNGERLEGPGSAVPPATTLTRLDGSSLEPAATAVLPDPQGPTLNVLAQHIAVVGSGVFAIGPDGSVVRLDPATGTVKATIRRIPAIHIAAGDGEVWVIGIDGTLARINQQTGRLSARIRIAAISLTGLAVGGGSVWLADPAGGSVWRVDPGPAAVTRTIPVGVGTSAVAYGNGAVWAVNSLAGTVARIDPATNEVVATVPVGNAPRGVATGTGGVWVTVAGGATGSAARAAVSGSDIEGVPGTACGQVFAGGERSPDVLIVSDLPLRGPDPAARQQMSEAIAFVLRKRGFRAGEHTVAYQSCDESTAQLGIYDAEKCAANAKAYAETPSVVGVIGPYNSGCALVELPILNGAEGGPLALVMPTASMVALTRRDPQIPDIPDLYPTGEPSAVRITPTEEALGAALAVEAKQRGIRSVYVLNDGDIPFGRSNALAFRRAAKELGLDVVGFEAWDPSARGYEDLAGHVRAERPDAVFLGGGLYTNGAKVAAAVLTALPGVQLFLSEGFLPAPALTAEAGPGAASAVFGVILLPVGALGERGQQFARDFGRTQAIPVDASAVHAAQSAEVLLDAIARSDGTRASVRRELFATSVEDGLLGSLRFDQYGDPVQSRIAILVADESAAGAPWPLDGARVDRVVEVPPELLR